ncbi:hypothetical protein JAAARDRAFT_462693 [Jaapia argillacea MUCL 33604]|uniref:Histone H1 n=1 Tax=Jaapia argillacea MUCL 33604 TaxID=933084 RepID=A0A067Q6D2_9AGAM|nr:hypothetical protein JAAARDRAFT_462693 [Jaapia argillacea MUCL 33604]
MDSLQQSPSSAPPSAASTVKEDSPAPQSTPQQPIAGPSQPSPAPSNAGPAAPPSSSNPPNYHPPYPHAPYGYPPHQAAYPHSPYYTHPPGYPPHYPPPPPPPPPHPSSPYPSYSPVPPPPNVYPQHPNPVFTSSPLARPPHPPEPPSSSAEDLPSYEDMIVEALTNCSDSEGLAPKNMFLWMAAHYPLQQNFRPSASQALQKAYKRGRFEKSNGGKYRLNLNWEGGNVNSYILSFSADSNFLD